MLVKYAIDYLQAKIREGENQSPERSSSQARTEPSDIASVERSPSVERGLRTPEKTPTKFVSKPRSKDIGYFRETITELEKLAADAPLSEITPILHRHRTENLHKSTYFNSFIQPLDDLLLAEQERLSKAEQERAEKERVRLEQEQVEDERVRLEQEQAEKERARLEQEKSERERVRLEQEKSERERIRLEQEKSERESTKKETSTGNSSESEDSSPPRDYLQDINTLRPTLNVKIIPKLDQLLSGLAKLSETEAAEKAKFLESTYNLLTEASTVKEYQDFAKTVQGKPSPVLKTIGALMIALAAAVVAFAFAVPTAGLSMEVAGYTATALVGPGLFSMFAGRQKGVSRDMEELANTHVAQLGN